MAISDDIINSHPSGAARALFSCVMADSPRFVQQTLTLVWTLCDLGGIDPDRIVVHCLEGSDPDARRTLDDLGVRTRSCEPFRTGHPYCNKIRQCASPELAHADVVVLLDTDMAVTGPIDALVDGVFTARAKIVDLPNPTLDEWRGILQAAGLSADPPLTQTSFGGHPTPAFNCNGGLYVLRGRDLESWGAAWTRWAEWLIARPALLDPARRIHVDQVAFGLAAFEGAQAIDLLPLAWNYPTHDAVSPKPDLDPHILHYHDRVDPSGLLMPVGQSLPDDAVARVNAVIRDRHRRAFDNRLFWNFRYRHAPDLGSGIGSRGANLEYKREVLAREISPDDAVLEIGCGDLEVSCALPVRRYTGVDVSGEALAIARRKRPDWTFLQGTVTDVAAGGYDAVVCLDVLIHQPSRAAYDALVSGLVRLATRTLLIAAYDDEPEYRSEITFYYEPITATLERLVGPGRTERVGRYRDTTMVRVRLS